MSASHTGRCYCGQVSIEITGQARMHGLCHCTSCRVWHGAPMTAFAGFPAEAVTITGETIQSSHRGQSGRVACAACGGAVANLKPDWGVTVVYATMFPDMPFLPALHLHYAERVMDIADGLPKFADFPERLGGTGAMAAEPDATQYRTPEA